MNITIVDCLLLSANEYLNFVTINCLSCSLHDFLRHRKPGSIEGWLLGSDTA